MGKGRSFTIRHIAAAGICAAAGAVWSTESVASQFVTGINPEAGQSAVLVFHGRVLQDAMQNGNQSADDVENFLSNFFATYPGNLNELFEKLITQKPSAETENQSSDGAERTLPDQLNQLSEQERARVEMLERQRQAEQERRQQQEEQRRQQQEEQRRDLVSELERARREEAEKQRQQAEEKRRGAEERLIQRLSEQERARMEMLEQQRQAEQGRREAEEEQRQEAVRERERERQDQLDQQRQAEQEQRERQQDQAQQQTAELAEQALLGLSRELVRLESRLQRMAGSGGGSVDVSGQLRGAGLRIEAYLAILMQSGDPELQRVAQLMSREYARLVSRGAQGAASALSSLRRVSQLMTVAGQLVAQMQREQMLAQGEPDPVLNDADKEQKIAEAGAGRLYDWPDNPYFMAGLATPVLPDSSLQGSVVGHYAGRLQGAFSDGGAVGGDIFFSLDFQHADLEGSVSFDGGAGGAGFHTQLNSTSFNAEMSGDAFGGMVNGSLNGGLFGPQAEEMGGGFSFGVTGGARDGAQAQGEFAGRQMQTN